MEPQTRKEPPSSTASTPATCNSGGGGAMDHFANLLLEGSNKRLTTENKKLKNKIASYEKEIEDLKNDSEKKRFVFVHDISIIISMT